MPEPLDWVAHRFDWASFHAAVDAARETSDLTWVEVSRQTGVSASTLSRLGQGKGVHLEGTIALVLWADLRMDDYIRRDRQLEPSCLAMAATFIHQDPSLTPAQRKALCVVLTTTYGQLRSAPPRALPAPPADEA